MKKFAVLAASIATASFAASAAEKVTYEDQVLPIFRNACNNCHNPDKKKAGLDLTTYQATLAGSENGKIVQSGNAAASLLFKCVKQTEDPKMPPKGDKLNDAELAIIEKWITGQLLENASGKAVAAVDNKVTVAVVSLTKPDGPPPMPGELSLEPVVRTRGTNALTALAVSPWAPLVAIGGQKQILLYHTETFEPLGVLPFPEGLPTIIRFSRNGQLLLTGGGQGGKSGKVVLWDIKTGERIATIGNEVDQVLAADLSADQQFVALGGPNKLVKIYATKDGKLISSIKKHTDWVTAIAYSPDGKYLASADRNGGIQVWEGKTGKEFNVLPGHKVMVTALAFMTGVLASSSEDGKVALWDVKEGKEIRSWAAHSGGAEWVDFTPDGRLVSCGRDKIAKAWDQNGTALGKTEPFADIALRAGLSNDRVIAGDWTGMIRVTNLAGKELAQLTANPPTLADRLADTTKRINELQATRPGLQQQFATAEKNVAAEKAAAEQKRQAEAAALEAAKVLPVQVEKKLAEAKASIEALTKARDAAPEADRAAAQPKIDEAQKQLAAINAEHDKAAADLKAKLAAAGAAKEAADKLVAQVAELGKKLESENAELAKLREVRAGRKDGTPEYKDANAKVDAKAADIVKTQAALLAAKKAAGQLPSPAEEALAKTKSDLDQANAQLAAVKVQDGRWKLAQLFQTVHNARQSLAAKKAAYDDLVATVKEALQPIDRIHNEITAAEKTAAETVAKLPEKENLVAQAQAAATPANQAVGAAQAAVADREKALKTLIDNLTQAAATKLADLTKQLAAQNAEATQLREARAAKAAGSPEYAEAEKLLQAKKAEIAATQAAVDQAKVPQKPAETPEAKAALAELSKSREVLDQTRAAAKESADKLALAEKDLTKAKAAAEAAKKQLAALKAKEPEVVKEAQATKAAAEAAVPNAEKELAAAKAQAEKVHADYESAKGGVRSASISIPPKG
ncbi:MAG: c-type cytochrome domain-containing protein [Chthoniobacteraceae bacterium]